MDFGFILYSTNKRNSWISNKNPNRAVTNERDCDEEEKASLKHVDEAKTQVKKIK